MYLAVPMLIYSPSKSNVFSLLVSTRSLVRLPKSSLELILPFTISSCRTFGLVLFSSYRVRLALLLIKLFLNAMPSKVGLIKQEMKRQAAM
jgi:hypothetical protein